MSKQIPTVGDTVIYWPDATDVQAVQDDNSAENGRFSNTPMVGQPMSAVVVASWGGGTVNVKVAVDGQCPNIWRTSIPDYDHAGDPVDGGNRQMCWEFEWQAQHAGRM